MLQGKCSQAPNKTKCTFVYEESELVKYLNDPTVNIKDFHIINENVIVVEHDKFADYIQSDDFSNIAVAALTTVYARLHLLQSLNSIEPEQLIYCDTDSILYKIIEGKPELSTGDYLGELTNELPANTYIESFMSSGPKSYGYKMSNGQTVLKIKGISLTDINSKVINYEGLRKVLFEKETLKTPFKTQFVRDKYNGRIFNRKQPKSFRLIFTKRRLLPDYNTVPFGY